MASRVRILAAAFLTCSVLPLLASSFLEHLPEVSQGAHLVEKGDLNPFNDPTQETPENENPTDIFGFLPFLGSHSKDEGLREGFYTESCPRAEEIVKEVVTRASRVNRGRLAGLVRLHSHDCLVVGCDASLLLDRDPTGGPVEKEAGHNGDTISGTEIIDEIKATLEKECPGVVSCADVLTFAARDALVLSGLPSYDVPSGRRDSRASLFDTVAGNLSNPTDSVDQMLADFAKKGLTMEDLVVLNGAHSIGVIHCSNMRYRTRDPAKSRETDPLVTYLINFQCTDAKAYLPFDSASQYKLDARYYAQLLRKRAMLESDQKLATDPRTAGLMRALAHDEQGFHERLAKSMVKMGNIGVLTGRQGEIRKNCRFVN